MFQFSPLLSLNKMITKYEITFEKAKSNTDASDQM